MRKLAAAFLLLALPAAALAQRHYAILSLVGDEMMIVQRELATGSRLDTNDRRAVQMPDATIDRMVVLAVEDAVKRAEPAAKTTLLVSRRQAVYDAVARALPNGTEAAFKAVRPVIDGARGATHLILVTKYRHAAMLRTDDGHVGSGTLEGVGFYLDRGGPLISRNSDTSSAERGLIAPYAYVRVSLVDLASGKVIAEERVIGSKAHTMGPAVMGEAWASLSAQEKDRRLQEVIREETARVTPKVIAAR
jgi:hypothetical protein